MSKKAANLTRKFFISKIPQATSDQLQKCICACCKSGDGTLMLPRQELCASKVKCDGSNQFQPKFREPFDLMIQQNDVLMMARDAFKSR